MPTYSCLNEPSPPYLSELPQRYDEPSWSLRYLKYDKDTSGLTLYKSLYGCKAGNRVINHLMFADDLVIFCPFVKGMSELLKVCEEHYGTNHDIKYNLKKSAVVIFS